jgi:hypothetical protein
LYVPENKPDIVVLIVFPDIDPGFNVQFPAGKPLKVTLPVETEQLGCVIELTVGAGGVTGCALIIKFADAAEIHPEALVTVNVFVPEVIPVTVLLTPVPAIAPGFMVQFPKGKPLNTTLPVAIVQVGCIINPGIGAVGVNGWALTIISADATEVHPAALVIA